VEIELDHLNDDAVVNMLREHLPDTHANSPPESIHALDVKALRHPSITFWVARDNGTVLGCVALRQLSRTHAEIKSMRNSPGARNRGVASRLLAHVVRVARTRGYERLSLETGSMDFFEPARRLYGRFGFK
jgi:putative acetyltransferase